MLRVGNFQLGSRRCLRARLHGLLTSLPIQNFFYQLPRPCKQVGEQAQAECLETEDGKNGRQNDRLNVALTLTLPPEVQVACSQSTATEHEHQAEIAENLIGR